MAELIVQDFGGRLNGDMSGTRARLIKGGSWRKQRIVCAIPASDMIPAKVALAMWNLIFPPNQGVIRMLCQGMEVGEAYSSCVQQCLDHPELREFEYLLCYEHDNLAPQDGLLKLLESMDAHPEYSAIGGLYFTKGEGGCAQIWGDPRDSITNFRPQIPIPETVQECCGVGQGFTLFRMSMFKDARLRKPWFVTQKGIGGVATQDLYLWSDARKYGFRCAIDTRVKVGHLDISSGVIW